MSRFISRPLIASLVEAIAALGERDLDLRAPRVEVDPRRHERQPALLGLTGELVDLAAMGEQATVALGHVVVERGRAVGSDVDQNTVGRWCPVTYVMS